MNLTKLFSSLFGSEKANIERASLPWVLEQSESVHGLTRLNWGLVYKRVEADFTHQDQHALWGDIAHTWLCSLRADLGDAYDISESDNFMMLSCESAHYNQTLLRYLEQCRRRLMHFLKGIANDDGFGKYVVIVFENNDRYYDYVSYFGPEEGTFGMSSGSFMSYGYEHFVFPHQDIHQTEPVAAHELTHAMVSHLPIPLWLNEGLAVNMEALLTGLGGLNLTRDLYAQHQSFWDEKNIQEFWRGESFSRPDDGQKLSYQLARILVSNLSEDQASFVGFCNKADWKDAGESAMVDFYQVSLSEMLVNFLGDGSWGPIPSRWN